MRHTQQLELIEKFKYECQAKGYGHSQPADSLKSDGKVEIRIQPARKKRSWLRWVRSNAVPDNGSASTAAQHYEDPSNSDDNEGFFHEGFFHEPATAPNDYLEAICGNLTLT